jgi:glycosyltransferase involved in cell wall biosynthesis
MISVGYFVDGLLSDNIPAPYQVQRDLLKNICSKQEELGVEVYCIYRGNLCEDEVRNAFGGQTIRFSIFNPFSWIKIYRLSIVHLVGLSPIVAIFSFLFGNVVTTIHGDATFVLPKNYFSKAAWKQHTIVKFLDYLRFFSRLRNISTVSSVSKSTLHKNLILNGKELTVINNAISDIYFKEKNITNKLNNLHGDSYILTVNNSAPKKNIKAVILAFDKLKSDFDYEGRLLIAGGGFAVNDIKKLNISDVAFNSIHLLGFCQQARLVELYDGASLFLNPTLHETFGLPNLEAIARGCKVITSDRHAIPEITNGLCVYLQDPLDICEIANKANSVLEKNEPGKPDNFNNKYSWSHITEQYVYWYKEVASGS